MGSIPGQERALGRVHGNPLQYSCLENPMDRGAWWVTVHSVIELETNEATQHTQHDLSNRANYIWLVYLTKYPINLYEENYVVLETNNTAKFLNGIN